MTNQELLIKALNEEIDDGGATMEAEIYYHIACPYRFGDKRALCNDDDNDTCREVCFKCKAQWLDSEVDL